MTDFKDLLAKWLRGDQDAIAFILAIHQIAEIWDDLIDQDKPVPPEAINAMLFGALVTLPRNPFYQRNIALLNPLVEQAIVDWHTANAFEKSGDVEKLRMAWVLRSSPFALTVMSSRIVGGHEWAVQTSIELWSRLSNWADYHREQKRRGR